MLRKILIALTAVMSLAVTLTACGGSGSDLTSAQINRAETTLTTLLVLDHDSGRGSAEQVSADLSMTDLTIAADQARRLPQDVPPVLAQLRQLRPNVSKADQRVVDNVASTYQAALDSVNREINEGIQNHVDDSTRLEPKIDAANQRLKVVSEHIDAAGKGR